jgi:predicted permease
MLLRHDWIRIPGKPYHGEHNDVMQRDVSARFMTTLKAKLVGGRMLTDSDNEQHPKAVLINETLARKYFPGEDPIGKMIGEPTLDPKSMRQVVGVVADVREAALEDKALPAEYFSIRQGPDSFFSLVVRTSQDEKALLPQLVRTIRQTHAALGAYGETAMADRIADSPGALLHKFSAWLMAGFAALALILAVVGLYGVIAFSVSRRTREIGVRMALGAQRSSVYTLVLWQAGWLTGMGLAIGLVCTVGASLLMRSLLFAVQPWDATTLGGVVVLLGVASMAAIFLPARHAASVNPTDALRAE